MNRPMQECVVIVITLILMMIAVVGVTWLIMYAGTAQQREITVVDIVGDYVQDTDGNVWRLQFDNPFDQHNLTVGSTILIRWKCWVSTPRIGEDAVFDGWVR